jgi:hypothetical protein
MVPKESLPDYGRMMNGQARSLPKPRRSTPRTQSIASTSRRLRLKKPLGAAPAPPKRVWYKRWYKGPDDAPNVLCLLLFVTLAVDGCITALLALGEFIIDDAIFGTLAACTLLAIAIVNFLALYYLTVGAPSWAREAVIAQVLMGFLAGFIFLINWRSPVTNFTLACEAAIILIVAIGWILILPGKTAIQWTKVGVAAAALIPLVGGLQFWAQTYYIPARTKPLVDISADLSPQGWTGATLHLSAKMTVHNRGSTTVYIANSLVRVTAYLHTTHGQASKNSCADQTKNWCRIASDIDLSGDSSDTDYRVNPTPPVDSQLLYAGAIDGGVGGVERYLMPGETDTFLREIDINSAQIRIARLTVSGAFFTERKIQDIRSCIDKKPASAFERFSEFSSEVRQTLLLENKYPVPDGHGLCRDYVFAPSSVIEKLIGSHPVLRVWTSIDNPADTGNEYPQIGAAYCANGFDNSELGKCQGRRLEDLYPTAMYSSVSEYAPTDKSPQTPPQPPPGKN